MPKPLKPEELEEKQRDMIKNLCDLPPEMKTTQKLAASFIEIVRQRQSEKLDEWIREVLESQIPELKSFTVGNRSRGRSSIGKMPQSSG